MRPIGITHLLLVIGVALSLLVGCDDGTADRDLPGVPDAGKRDIDCSDLEGPVEVTGGDRYGLDRDGDGIGCEWGPDGEPDTGDEFSEAEIEEGLEQLQRDYGNSYQR